MNRHERHGVILRLVRDRSLSTQAELVAALREAGHSVVQTTISRDIHDLGLVKIRNEEGRLVYAPPGAADPVRRELLNAALGRWALACEPSYNLLVVETPPGFASPLAQAIDESSHPLVAGTIAGENTVLLVAREPATGRDLADEIRPHLLLLKGVA
jgi:transcriptional regulator of arginine metabolism